MSPTTSIPVFPISAVIAVTFLDSEPAGCTTLAASLSFISCLGLRCDGAELITFSTLGSAFDPSRYDTTQDRCIPSKPRFANLTGQLQMFVKPEPRMPPTTRLLTRQARPEVEPGVRTMSSQPTPLCGQALPSRQVYVTPRRSFPVSPSGLYQSRHAPCPQIKNSEAWNDGKCWPESFRRFFTLSL